MHLHYAPCYDYITINNNNIFITIIIMMEERD